MLNRQNFSVGEIASYECVPPQGDNVVNNVNLSIEIGTLSIDGLTVLGLLVAVGAAIFRWGAIGRGRKRGRK